MSMEVNGSGNLYKTDYVEHVKAEREEIEKGQNDGKMFDKMPVLQDEYIGSEKADKPSGMYRLGQDKNGNKKVLFDKPKKDKADGNGKSEIKPDNPEKAEKKCTVNTDKVDREIKKLKEERQQLQQQIQSASSDEKKVRNLKKKLAQVEWELKQKDNDTYRRQNASVSE